MYKKQKFIKKNYKKKFIKKKNFIKKKLFKKILSLTDNFFIF